jgi:LemA protein
MNGEFIGFGFLAVIAFFIIWFIATYNTLVRLRNYCAESWSGIDTELKRRYDLIPNLVQTVKGYAKHEQETFTRVIEARNRAAENEGTPEQQAQDENAFIRSLRGLFALSEGYPDLKANHSFLELQHELANTEDRIQASRRFYNANVRDLNTRIEVFPSNMVASMYGFQKKEYFEIEDSGVRNAPAISMA